MASKRNRPVYITKQKKKQAGVRNIEEQIVKESNIEGKKCGTEYLKTKY